MFVAKKRAGENNLAGPFEASSKSFVEFGFSFGGEGGNRSVENLLGRVKKSPPR
jgi:hypothetical protein